MNDKDMLSSELKGVGRFIGHSASVFIGLLLLIGALAMGVTLVLLPGALIAATFGLLLITWGMYVSPRAESDDFSKPRNVR